MTNLQKKQNLCALAGTVAVWILIFILIPLVSLLPERPVYKSVQITLSEKTVPKPAEKKLEKSVQPVKSLKSPQNVPPSAPQSAQKSSKNSAQKTEVETKKTPVKKNEGSAQKTPAAKTSSAQKASSKPVSEKPAVQTLQKSVDELMAEQRSKKTTATKEFDWSQFEDEAVEKTSKASSSSVQKASPAITDVFEGTAGTSGKSESTPVAATSRTEQTGMASDSTSRALEKISSAVYSSNSTNGVAASSTVKSSVSSDGKVTFLMDEGSTRTLLEPTKPIIELSAQAASTIDTTKNLTVRFTVLPNGHVDLNSITVTPGAIISPAVQNEIAAQISVWRFNQDSSSATASFPYRIEKR
ncbi:hypothetical protein [Treponema berlinense]|uniref:hypothetical protein n=1 Tax=Treponema berlinense TaxID=225004 RepID=UPI0026F0E1ED|nr:hypothetical protein [Treponema berlinense]